MSSHSTHTKHIINVYNIQIILIQPTIEVVSFSSKVIFDSPPLEVAIVSLQIEIQHQMLSSEITSIFSMSSTDFS